MPARETSEGASPAPEGDGEGAPRVGAAEPARSKGSLTRALAAVWRMRLFVLLAVTYAYFYQGGDPNQATRIFLTRSLVERHEPDITPYHADTIDKSEFDGKFWCDKAPAVSMMATVPWALMNAADSVAKIDRASRPAQRVRMHMVVIVISGLSGVLTCFFLHRALGLFGARARVRDLLTLGYGLGTLAFPFSTVLFGHQTAAALLAASFYYLVEATLRLPPARAASEPSAENASEDTSPITPRRLALLGALWGLALTTEYPTGILVACQGLYLLAHDRSVRGALRVFGWTAAGAALPLGVHSLFLWWAFGSPFSLPYSHMAEPIFLAHVSTGLLGINLPSFVGIVGVFFGRYRGLFFLCPFLILTFFGFRAWITSGERRKELWLVAAQVLGYAFFCTSYYAWDGGGSTGPRHLVPALAFFVLPIAWFCRSRRAEWIAVAALVPSVLVMLACTATLVQTPEGDPWRANPLYDLVVATLLRGEIAVNRADVHSLDPRGDASYNLGTLVGLSSVASLLPLLAAWLVAYLPSLLGKRAEPA